MKTPFNRRAFLKSTVAGNAAALRSALGEAAQTAHPTPRAQVRVKAQAQPLMKNAPEPMAAAEERLPQNA